MSDKAIFDDVIGIFVSIIVWREGIGDEDMAVFGYANQHLRSSRATAFVFQENCIQCIDLWRIGAIQGAIAVWN